MALACEVRRVLSKNPNSIKPDDFALKFVWKEPEKKRQKSKANNKAAISRGTWLASLGIDVNDPKLPTPKKDRHGHDD